METVTLNKSPFRFYAVIIFILIVSLSVGLVCIGIGYHRVIDGDIQIKNLFLFLFGILFIFIGIKFLLVHIKNSISLRIIDDQLYYKNIKVSISEIESINLREIIDFEFFVLNHTYGTSIKLKNNIKILIVDGNNQVVNATLVNNR